VRSTFVSLTGAIVILAAGTVSSPAWGDEFAFQRLAGLASADVSANLQALRDDFALVPSEAERLGAAIAGALSDGTAVRAVTFALILMVVGAGLEWFYWTFAAAPPRAITSTTATTPRHAVGLASRRLAHLGFGVMLFTASTVGAALILPWPPNVEVMVIAVTALVVAVRSAWIIADVVVSPHHPSLRLTATQEYNPGFVVGGVTWLMMLAAAAVLLPQLLTTVGSAPHLGWLWRRSRFSHRSRRWRPWRPAPPQPALAPPRCGAAGRIPKELGSSPPTSPLRPMSGQPEACQNKAARPLPYRRRHPLRRRGLDIG
jgi:hypothetical protein